MKQLSKRRKAAAIVTVILAIALAVTGTMAAFIYNDEETNEWGDIVTPGGNGHDDFGGGDNKDVYFENYGSATLYVRIRLDEYMEFGTGSAAKSMVKNAKRNDKTTWCAHVPAAKGTPHICAPAPATLETAGVDFHDYWTWKMGGTYGERYYLPTNPTSSGASNVQKGPFYTIADLTSNPQLKPIPDATVVTMAKWIEDGLNLGNFWVVDTDGWAYWASPLLSKQVTGLLLNEVKLTTKPATSYYYAINVRYYATDADDIGSMRAGATPEGNTLIDKLLNASGNPGNKSLDDLLDDAIKRAEDALKDADDNPGKYTQDSYDDLKDALDDAIDVRDNPSSTDSDKQGAIDDIEDNLPLKPTPPSNLGPATLPGGTTGAPYSATLTATSAFPVTWSLDSGTLPPGLTLNPTTGVISGNPTTAGNYNFTVKATNAGGSTTKPMSIAIVVGTVAPVISTTTLPGGMVGTAYNQTLAISAGTAPITWSVDSGSLPGGLTLNTGTGVISGTPTADGTFNFTIKATNSAGSDTQTLSIGIGTTTLQTLPPTNPARGYEPIQDALFPENDHGTHVKTQNGTHLPDIDNDRFCAIALNTIVSDISGVTVAAVDPALSSYIVKENDSNGGAPSIVFKWLPTGSGTVADRFAALNNSTTSVGNFGVNGTWTVTTDVILTKVVGGVTQTATVKVTFNFNHSVIT